MNADKLFRMARRMELNPAEAVVLPAAIERAAAMVGLSADALLLDAENNNPLRKYLASVCRKVAEK